MSKRLNLLVLCGGPSSEYEVSLKTARMVLRNLDRKKYNPSIAVIKKNGEWKFSSRKQAIPLTAALSYLQKRCDFVFIAMHGAFGEDGRIQALLEWIGVPYAGSGVLSSAMAMDKQVSNELFEPAGLCVPKYTVFHKGTKWNTTGNLRFPVVIKPVTGGSSVGIAIIKRRGDLPHTLRLALQKENGVMIQEYVKGREMTCGVLEDQDGEPFALPPTEIIPKHSSFFDYRAKYKIGGSNEITPPQLPQKKIKELQSLAVRAHKILNCNGMSRSDFILAGSHFYILEINTIPGMTETSLLPQAALAAHISFPQLLDLIINAGLRRATRTRKI